MGPHWGDRIVLNALRGDRAEVEHIIATYFEQDDRNAALTGYHVVDGADDFETARRLARTKIRADNSPARQGRGYYELAEVAVGQGRWEEARQELQRLGEVDSGLATTTRGVFASLPHLATPREDLESAFAELLEWAPDAPDAATPPGRAYEPHRRSYPLALLASKLGDSGRALSYADSVEALPDLLGTAVPAAAAATIRADVAWRAGRSPESVLEALEPVRGQLPAAFWRVEIAFSEEHARLLRAEALYAAGDLEEALQLLRNGFTGTPGSVYYKAPVYHLAARAHAASGRPGEAGEARDAFERVWSGADSPIALPER